MHFSVVKLQTLDTYTGTEMKMMILWLLIASGGLCLVVGSYTSIK